MSEPRSYRDAADIDDALDAIRACPDRDKAREFFIACLDCANQEGRVDFCRERIEAVLTENGVNISDPRVQEYLSKRNGDNPSRSI